MNNINLHEEIVTLGQWLAYWIETYIRPTHKPTVYKHYHDNCFIHVMPAIGEMALSEITPTVLRQFFSNQAAHGNLRTGGPLPATSIKKMRAILDMAMKKAVAEGRIPANPVPPTYIHRIMAPRVEALTDNELKKLEKYLFSGTSQYSRAEIMSMYTGALCEEICALRWKNYNPQDGTLTFVEAVKRVETQGLSTDESEPQSVLTCIKSDASERTVALPQFLKDILEEQRIRFALKVWRVPNKNDFIFFGRKGSILDPEELMHYLSEVLEELGMQKPHFLRDGSIAGASSLEYKSAG